MLSSSLPFLAEVIPIWCACDHHVMFMFCFKWHIKRAGIFHCDSYVVYIWHTCDVHVLIQLNYNMGQVHFIVMPMWCACDHHVMSMFWFNWLKTYKEGMYISLWFPCSDSTKLWHTNRVGTFHCDSPVAFMCTPCDVHVSQWNKKGGWVLKCNYSWNFNKHSTFTVICLHNISALNLIIHTSSPCH